MKITRRQFGLALGASLTDIMFDRYSWAANSVRDGMAQPDLVSTSGLFPGEEIITAAGFPTLVKFIKGQPDKPLVVFIPGTSFLARIAYGFPGGRSADFLSHWLVQSGYSFLGTSYPLENAVYQRVFPEFGITDWGKQAAEAARHFIDANGLGKRLIVVGWSMGGKPVETVAKRARELGLDLELFVALDALPPGPNLLPGNPEQLRLAANGMVDQVDVLMPWFQQMVDVQNRMNHHAILPADRFRAEFTGNPPLGIQGENARLVDGRMVSDVMAAAADSGATDYGSYPSMALVISDSDMDYPNVLLCATNWGLLVGQQLYRRHVYPVRDRMAQLPPEKWQSLQHLFATAMTRLTIQVDGTHFLFIGEKGARETAKAITDLAGRSAQLNREIATLLASIQP